MNPAASLGADIIVGSLRGVIPDMARREVYDRRFFDCLSELLAVSEPKGVRILLEVINRYENNYMNTARETLEYLEPLAGRNVKIHLDTFHMNIEEPDMAAAIRVCGGRLGYIHAADNTRRHPGSGAIDFRAVFAALDDAGYGGYVSVECLALPDGDVAAAKAIAAMNAAHPGRG